MGDNRNVLVEAARITRGKISPLGKLDPRQYDALIIPGGFGVAKNLCNHATLAQGDPTKMIVDPDLTTAIEGFNARKKPIGFCCIAPVVAAYVLKCKVTVGQAEGDKWPYGGTVAAIQGYGGTHEMKGPAETCIDNLQKVVTSPAYMYEGTASDTWQSVGAMVNGVLSLVGLTAQPVMPAVGNGKGKRVAVVLAGCGVFDGSEITEAISSLIHLTAAGCAVDCYAPDQAQHHAVDHTTGKEMDNRNVLVEAARIARGKIPPLGKLAPSQYDALIIPGGFGTAKNLCNHATVAQGDAAKMVVDPDLTKAIQAFSAAKKPAGFCCIAPVIAAYVLKCKVTVGQAEGDKWPYGGTVGAIQAYGGTHEAKGPTEACVDQDKKVVTTPAYMYEGTTSEIHNSVGAMVKDVLALA